MGQQAIEEVEKALNNFIRQLKKTHRIERILLFGSRSRLDHLKSSDVDLVIVSPDFEGIGWRERIISVARLWKGRVRLEPLCYTPEEFRKRSRELTIVRKARAEGIRLA